MAHLSPLVFIFTKEISSLAFEVFTCTSFFGKAKLSDDDCGKVCKALEMCTKLSVNRFVIINQVSMCQG